MGLQGGAAAGCGVAGLEDGEAAGCQQKKLREVVIGGGRCYHGGE